MEERQTDALEAIADSLKGDTNEWGSGHAQLAAAVKENTKSNLELADAVRNLAVSLLKDPQTDDTRLEAPEPAPKPLEDAQKPGWDGVPPVEGGVSDPTG